MNLHQVRAQAQEKKGNCVDDYQNHLTQSARRLGQVEDLGQLKLSTSPSPSISKRRSPHPSQSSTPIPPTTIPIQQIRKCLVVLQDSLAIKFVPFTSTLNQTTPMSSLSNSNRIRESNTRQNQRSTSHTAAGVTERNSNRNEIKFENHVGRNFPTVNNFSQNGKYYNFAQDGRNCNSQNGFVQEGKSSQNDCHESLLATSGKTGRNENAGGNFSSNGPTLYKSFLDVNLQCYWNPTLWEAVTNLEYKGYIVPFTVLVSASHPRFLTTLRVAWSRQMLRSPPGYRIEFIGEVEELLADPIPQSQFAPLSDSLCWAILEVTSTGQEAFVNNILTALNTNFPTMIMPNRELVYQTLEKLVRDGKVCQTSTGYFVVGPDISTYVMNSSSSMHHHPPHHHHQKLSDSSATILQDMNNQQPFRDSDKVSRHSWDSTASAENPVSDVSGTEKNADSRTDPPLRRHNSLRTIRQKDKESGTLKFLRGRSFSFRMYKSQSTPIRSSDGTDSLSPAKENSNFESSDSDKKKKSGKTFFRKLFKRSSHKESAPDVAVVTGVESSIICSNKQAMSATAATQTPPITHPKEAEQGVTYVKSHAPQIHDILRRANPAGVKTVNENITAEAAPLQVDGNRTSIENLNESRWNSLERPRRSHSRLSLTTPTIVDDDPNLYALPRELYSRGSGVHANVGVAPGDFSRCSTMSRGSLGYGSQGHGSQGNSDSRPLTPMSSTNRNRWSALAGPPPAYSHLISRNSGNYGSYRNAYDFYRRKSNPGYRNFPKLDPPTMGRPTDTSAEKPFLTRTGTWGPTCGSHVHYYETIGSSRHNKPSERQKSTMTEVINGIRSKENAKFPSPRITKVNRKDEPFVATTTVTQNSTTNMEVELRLPRNTGCGSSSSGGGTIHIKGNDTKVNVNVGAGDVDCENGSGSTKIHIEQPATETEVKTVIHGTGNGGTVTTHFDYRNDSDRKSKGTQQTSNPL